MQEYEISAHRYLSKCANTLINIENQLVKPRDTTFACEKFEGRMPSYCQNLCIFGEMAILKDNGKKMKGKLKDRGMTAMFV